VFLGDAHTFLEEKSYSHFAYIMSWFGDDGKMDALKVGGPVLP